MVKTHKHLYGDNKLQSLYHFNGAKIVCEFEFTEVPVRIRKN